MTDAPVAAIVPRTFAWGDHFKSGHAGIDATHQAFVAHVRALLEARDTEIDVRLQQLEQHCRAHFDEERALMARHAFPAAGCHVDEHDAVLASIAEVRALGDAARRTATARRLAASLAEWFAGHLTYMDASLAQWVVRHTHGGTPVVLRRHAGVDASPPPP